MEHPEEEVDDGLVALSHGPHRRVRFCSSCIVNGVRYNTLAREKYLQTQNSGIVTDGSHGDHNIDFYGVLNEIIELKYNSNRQCLRTVVLFGCDWYNQVGKTRGISDDGHFKSINIRSFWYKSDPYIFATQARKVFYMEDTLLGKDWRVVQKVEHRDMYDVAEKSDIAYQDDHCSETQHVVQEGDGDGQQMDGDGAEVNDHGGAATRVEGRLDELIGKRKQASISDDDDEQEDEDDDTVMQYCSDSDNENTEDDMCQPADSDDDL